MSEIKIFVSYSHRDTQHIQKEGLLGFLSGLESDSSVSFWVDEQLAAGDLWDDTIRRELASCHIALILVSQSFLDSQYCMDIEVSTFLDRLRQEGLRVFPVVLSACEWERHPWLSDYQMLPGGNETLEEDYQDPGQRKRLYLKIRKALRAMIDEVRRGASLPQEPEVNLHESPEKRMVTLVKCALSVDGERYGFDSDDELEFLYEAAPQFNGRCLSEAELSGGYLVSSDASGNATLCFGYPAARENDCLSAIRASLGILRLLNGLNQQLYQEWNAKLSIRIGVHTGPVIGKAGDDTVAQLSHSQTADFTGQIMALAPDGAIAISGSSHRLVEGFFKTQNIAELPSASGALATVHQVLEDKGLTTRFEASVEQGLMPLVGRQQEAAIIKDRWHQARQGKGSMVLVTADAGLGKSRLLEEVVAGIGNESALIVRFQASQFYQNSAFYPLIQGLSNWLGISELTEDAQKRAKLLERCRFLGEGAEEVAYLVCEFLGVEYPEAHFSELSPKQMKQQMLEAVLGFMIESADQTPMLLVIEDLHWLDPSSVDGIERTLEELRASSILCLVSARPEFELPSSWQAHDHFMPIKLDQLSRDQVQQMILTLTGGQSIPTAVFNEIYNKTEGYPLYVEELTNMVLESGHLTAKNGRLICTNSDLVLGIPDSLHEVLMARVSRLQGGKLIAQVGSIIGREFSFSLLKSVMPMSESALKEGLGRLIEAGLLYKQGVLSRAKYTFKHALVQDALYESMLKRERRRYHKLIAQNIQAHNQQLAESEPEILAHHFHQSGDYSLAFDYALKAAQLAMADFAHKEAIEHCRIAQAMVLRQPQEDVRNANELKVLEILGPALLAVSGWSSPEIGEVYLRSRALCEQQDDPKALFKASRGLWAYYMVLTHLDRSLEIAADLLAMAHNQHSDDMWIEAHTAYADSHFWLSLPLKTLEHAEQGLVKYEFERHHHSHCNDFGEDPQAVMHCYQALSLWLVGRTADSEALIAKVVAGLDRYEHDFSRGFALNGLAWYYIHRHQPEMAAPFATALKHLAIEKDFGPWLSLAQAQCGWVAMRRGQLEQGAAELKLGIEQFQSSGSLVSLGFNYSLLIDGYLHGGKADLALENIELALLHFRQHEERHFYSEVLRQHAEALSVLQPDSPLIPKRYQQALAFTKARSLVSLSQRVAASMRATQACVS